MEDNLSAAIRHVLKQYPQIKFATVFGSAARGRLRPESDVDVAVAARAPLPLETRLDLAARLSQALRREVDLVDLQEASGTILQQSLCQGQLLLNKEPAVYAGLITRLWFNQADMMPYTRRILAERRRRFLHG